MFDIVIRGGTVVDGSGGAPFAGDVAVQGGVIVDVAPHIAGDAAQVIYAAGKIVTPGWVDIHTHFDAQITWDSTLEPSFSHGVTTVVTGNCGVGFAPVRKGREEWLVQLMEGVEDIPGSVLNEGIRWGWESFPDYLRTLEAGRWTADVGTQIAHGPLRGYVMDERGASNEAATEDDARAMERLVEEAIAAGALGVSTSRTRGHRGRDGRPVPGTYASREELLALARGMKTAGGGVFECAPIGLTMFDKGKSTTLDLDWMIEIAETTQQRVLFSLGQVDGNPDDYARVLERLTETDRRGIEVYGQAGCRPFGTLIGFGSYHPFSKRPSWAKVAGLPYTEQLAAAADPAFKARLLAEVDGPVDPTIPFDVMPIVLQTLADRLFVLGDPQDYEPTRDATIAAIAKASGKGELEVMYDAMLGDDARGSMLLYPAFNYSYGDHEAIRAMITHPRVLSTLGDAGAHVRMICDASIPTWALTHWVRDRSRGARLPLELIVHKHTRETATMIGLTDRGIVAKGKKADLNVIDMSKLTLGRPDLSDDLPAGGRRLLQGATGYDATVLSGVVTRRFDRDTGERPGRLLRGRR